MGQLAERYGVYPLTIRNWLHKALEMPPPALGIPAGIPRSCWLVTDATHFKRWGCLFVTKAVGVKWPLAISFHHRECFETAVEHLKPLEELAVTGYTTDGKKGLVMAHRLLFPDSAGQRCLVHIRMKVQTLLTHRPKLLAGQMLLKLATYLNRVEDTWAAQIWWETFCVWEEAFTPILNERTRRGRSWWYTHRNLRRAHKHILNAADNLFVFLKYPDSVSHTNHLEGFFGQRKPALSRHRGLSRRRVACALIWTMYLLSKRP